MEIYKDGVCQVIHPIDFPGWQKVGWSKDPSSIESEEDERSSLLSINLASVEELTLLEGVGKVAANKIINGRPYESLEDLKALNLATVNWDAIAPLIAFEI